MPKIKVINKKFSTGAPEELYIGRGSVWGNDWSSKNYGKAVHQGLGSPEESVRCYRDWILNSRTSRALDLRKRIFNGELTGKTLVCFCVDKHGNGECHGKVLAQLGEARDYMVEHNIEGHLSAVADEMRDGLLMTQGILWDRCECDLHW